MRKLKEMIRKNINEYACFLGGLMAYFILLKDNI